MLRTRYCTHDGRTLTLVEWSRISGVPPFVILWRLRDGWPTGDAIFTPWEIVRRRKLSFYPKEREPLAPSLRRRPKPQPEQPSELSRYDCGVCGYSWVAAKVPKRCPFPCLAPLGAVLDPRPPRPPGKRDHCQQCLKSFPKRSHRKPCPHCGEREWWTRPESAKTARLDYTL